jgi:alpha-N-arabinofuranosidase
MERNSDLVTMQCYAPIFANVNEYQWRPNLMGYDALQAFGSPSYHALRLFSNNVGDSILKTTLQDAPGLHATATHDSRNRTIIVKIVNPLETAQKLRFELRGARAVSPKARVEVLSAPPTATNSISAPRQVVPVIRELLGLEPAFIYSVAPHSITVLTIREQ